ncbi:hypothetical protein [Actinokineospora inagensis]|uniref:hypothetical protein n=1 Tax=Actinokineospora inagensis TaxID=103730 RepID=UPI000400DCF4|nr:hypothetical protein [Actinokineospora inagensis]
MRSDLEINTWAKVSDTCDISVAVEGGDLSVQFRGQLDNFEMLFSPAGLDQLIAAATRGRDLLKSAAV